MNHFSRFSLPPSPDLDQKELTERYFALQRQYHPDRYAGKTSAEHQQALGEAMLVNEGYNILKDPLKRAEYLLLLQGIKVNTETGGVTPSPQLLMEAMEAREQLAESHTAQAIEGIKTRALADKERAFRAFSTYYHAGQLTEATQEVIRLKYIYKLLEEVKITHASA